MLVCVCVCVGGCWGEGLLSSCTPPTESNGGGPAEGPGSGCYGLWGSWCDGEEWHLLDEARRHRGLDVRLENFALNILAGLLLWR